MTNSGEAVADAEAEERAAAAEEEADERAVAAFTTAGRELGVIH